jgi:hypothetical protein
MYYYSVATHDTEFTFTPPSLSLSLSWLSIICYSVSLHLYTVCFNFDIVLFP